jgi:phytoene synthase
MTSYCFDYVKKTDADRFILALMAPQQHRDALMTLFAFNQEIAKTREVVSETTIGLIRLQWWRDAIGEIYDGKEPRHHAVISPLAQMIHDYDLPREPFDSLIYAREFDLEGVAPANQDGLVNYCDFTNAPLNILTLKVLHEEENEDVIRQNSINHALVGLTRALPNMLSQRRVIIPQDVMAAYRLDEVKLLDTNQKEKLPKIVEELLGLCDFTHRPTSKFLKRVHKMNRLYVNQIKSVNYDVFDPRLSVPPKFLALRLLFCR